MKVLSWLENAIMRMVFAYTASHKRAVLLSFELELTESLLDIPSYPVPTMGPTMVGPGETLSK